jgi:hypothetical protein
VHGPVTRLELTCYVREQSWREGWAHEWALDAGQRDWRVAFWGASPLSSTVWNVGRQRGKTFAAVFLALETGLSVVGGVIRYCAKTKDSAVAIVSPAWDYLVATMPAELRPVKGRNDYEWVFPSTGATFVLFGTDAQSFAKGRGPKTTLQLFDEAGFYQDLVQVESALLPSLQTTGGRALYLSTPAESVGHPYTSRIYAALAAGRYVHDTFWSNPRVDHEAVIEAERTRLGMSREQFLLCTYFRRESRRWPTSSWATGSGRRTGMATRRMTQASVVTRTPRSLRGTTRSGTSWSSRTSWSCAAPRHRPDNSRPR